MRDNAPHASISKSSVHQFRQQPRIDAARYANRRWELGERRKTPRLICLSQWIAPGTIFMLLNKYFFI
jgi:hypothetical protein